ncbi:MAG: tRNA lysidine(34) synthetase TilS [Mycobacteriales bacterium]
MTSDRGPAPAVAAVRVAVRRLLVATQPAGVLVACSGGADSVALAAATAVEAPKLDVPAGLVTVEHGLQAGSAEQAAAVAGLGRRLGLDPVRVCAAEVGTAGGPEAAARTARYAALSAVLESVGDGAASPRTGWAVLLGHTLDDQAETVLLGLGRGSGPRSVAGMRPVDGCWLRPLLGVRREQTRDACAAEGLPVWDDPHNADPRFTRARLRAEVLPLLEDVLAGGAAEALARTAELLRDDLDALDALAATVAGAMIDRRTVDAVALAAHPRAVRTRVLRDWIRAAGVAAPTSAQLRALDALVTDWHGQGPVALPSGLAARRASGRLHLDRSTAGSAR